MSLPRSIASLSTLLTALLLSGCGGSSHKRVDAAAKLTPGQVACIAPARAAMALFLHLSPGGISESPSVGNNDMPQCLSRARLGFRRTVDVLVNVDDGPSPYFRLARADVEDAQGFPTLDHAPPSAVLHLGLEANWFPQYPQLMTTDGYRLITVTVTWRHEPQRDDRALAIAMARPFLHTPHGKAAAKVAKDYP